jgi:hypothetical protein
MKMANDPSPEAIAELILGKYPPERLKNELRNFEWNDANFEEGWAKRQGLEQSLRAAVEVGSESGIGASISEIYRWGFKRNAPNVDGDDWRKTAEALVREFTKSEPDILKQKAALNMLLNHKGIKIATASKWICFCDQTKYAIYDSRVSIALRDIVGTNGKRLFPTIGRRQTKASQYPNADAVTPAGMVERYFFYLDTLNIVSQRTHLKAAEIEMALFMIGK